MKLKTININNFVTESGKTYSLQLSYQVFGKSINEAPVVLVNHALTGNSNVAGSKGWWSSLIGKDKCIDTNKYAVLAFNIPGNGFEGENVRYITTYKDFVAKDIARIFLLGLEELKLTKVYATIGGSLGGGICWEMAVLSPKLFTHIIPIASHYESSHWVKAQCHIQDEILQQGVPGLALARKHAMTLYRNPKAFSVKFNAKNGRYTSVVDWLSYHGEVLSNRFNLKAYLLMNHLLGTINITAGERTKEDLLEKIEGNFHVIGIDSDILFTKDDCEESFLLLKDLSVAVEYHLLHSIHGHDGFLIEFEKLEKILSPIFNNTTKAVKHSAFLIENN